MSSKRKAKLRSSLETSTSSKKKSKITGKADDVIPVEARDVSSRPLKLKNHCRFIGRGRPFGRLWWDEPVATIVTRARLHN
ncbi:DNA (cytosine-5)-methyltransferase [Actinidia chinensis var. chinensis]|uniref:DNA (Cytosine-5)-methyltransferase n=1 Tax=Actinidia chinensis var. chinensis TaxID=1590841 RepID=A0A2R6PXD1_ACTCC|nr:DNA (cytosine-5)-methyltransferase [Actinidia chinensis var. chinensis]